MRDAKLALLVANYNNAIYLREFFDSIKCSSILPDQIIFVDDGSSDDSLEVAESFKSELPVEIIALEKNVGFANALNIGLAVCNAEFIARIDPDDKVSSDRFSKQISYLISNPDVDVVGSQVAYFSSEHGGIVSISKKPVGIDACRTTILNADNAVIHGSVMIRASVFKNYSYQQAEVPSEDYALFARMLSSNVKFDNIDEVLTHVRVHQKSVSNNIKLSTIKKVYMARESYLGLSYGKVSVFFEYLALRYYRKFMFEKGVVRFFYAAVAGISSPSRVMKRIFSK